MKIVNEGRLTRQDLLVSGERIERIDSSISLTAATREVDASGKYLIPGVIDDQVHFREPGLTHKADIHTESRAAVAGGVTSFMEMPNTRPPALTLDLLEQKYAIASQHAVANYSFFMGVSNDNVSDVLSANAHKQDICGVKIFMGSSTGNMLVDNLLTLEAIFGGTELLIATHCEDERVIKRNLQRVLDQKQGRPLEPSDHPLIRDEEACFESSFLAVQLAKKHQSRLHILHITTARELQLFTNLFPLQDKRITSEVCVHHLYFTAEDYSRYGNLIKCNPAIKAPQNREALWEALLDDRLDIIATDHAPHTREEKAQAYPQAPAGLPLVQHGLLMMLEHHRQGRLSLEKVVEKMCHAPARCFRLKERGFLREGYYADLALLDLEDSTEVSKDTLLYKCAWSPFEGHRFPARVLQTYVNGHLVYSSQGIDDSRTGMRLKFDRS